MTIYCHVCFSLKRRDASRFASCSVVCCLWAQCFSFFFFSFRLFRRLKPHYRNYWDWISNANVNMNLIMLELKRTKPIKMTEISKWNQFLTGTSTWNASFNPSFGCYNKEFCFFLFSLFENVLLFYWNGWTKWTAMKDVWHLFGTKRNVDRFSMPFICSLRLTGLHLTRLLIE